METLSVEFASGIRYVYCVANLINNVVHIYLTSAPTQILQVNRAYEEMTGKYEKNAEDKMFRKHMIHWFYSFTSEITNKEMEKDSLKKLNAYIAEVKSLGNVNPELITYTEVFKTKSPVPNLYRLCQRHYMGIAFGHEAANCFTESKNARLYKDPQGPKANNKLHVAGEKIIQNTTKAYKTIMTSDNRNAKRTSIPNLPESNKTK